MVDRAEYDKDPAKFAAKPKFKHAEHIIQNALYGRLKPSNILCETCGGKLSGIDADFADLFSQFTVPIYHILASKDHGSNSVRAQKGELKKPTGETLEVYVKKGKAVPIKPTFVHDPETRVLKIYANAKSIEGYKNYVLKELASKGTDVAALSVELHEHILDYEQIGYPFSKGVENFNLKFKLGLNKIATGFAISSGVDRKAVPRTLDTEKQEIVFSKNIVPFFPVGALDLLVEPFRLPLEPEFPTHTLILYTDDAFPTRWLVCYIDLFSTFQHYVVLNDDYRGVPVHNVYYQTIIKQNKPTIEVRKTRWKYLGIVADAIGVDKKEMAGMSIEEMYDFLEKKYEQLGVSYSLDINEMIRAVSGRVSMMLAARRAGIELNHLSDIERQILDATPDLDIDDMLSMYFELGRIEDESPDSFYKQNYIDADIAENPFLHSTLMKMIELNNEGFDGFKGYGHSKFYELEHFVRVNEERGDEKH
jgi:hypothetical protein